jgi:hypothetical protein
MLRARSAPTLERPTRKKPAGDLHRKAREGRGARLLVRLHQDARHVSDTAQAARTARSASFSCATG